MDGINQLIESIRRIIKKETNAYDTTATVRRIDGDTAWVHIPGGVDETPVKLTIAASAGDNVQVRVSGGKAFLVGNGSAPPTDDTEAIISKTIAIGAQTAADDAKETAEAVEGIAASAQAAATRADEAATRAEGKANDASRAAGDAQTAAGNAQESADSALVSLSTVEDVVGVLNWITAHGTMTNTQDLVPPETVIDPSHVYFVQDDVTPGDYHVGAHYYAIVSEPKQADIASYYLLTVDKSVENYVATHVAADTEGLWIIPDSYTSGAEAIAANGKKILIATGAGNTYKTAGTYIINKASGKDIVLAFFGVGRSQIGEDGASQLVMTPTRLTAFSEGVPFFDIDCNGGASTVQARKDYPDCDVTVEALAGTQTIYQEVWDVSGIANATVITPVTRNNANFTTDTWSSPDEYDDFISIASSNMIFDADDPPYESWYHCSTVPTITIGTDSTFTAWLKGDYVTITITIAYDATAQTVTYSITYERTADKQDASMRVRVSGLSYTFETTTAAPAFTLGTSDGIRGNFSGTIGEGLQAAYANQITVGAYNDNKSTTLFEVGKGSANNARSNAFEVYNTGDIEAAGDITAGGGVTDGAGNVLSTKVSASTTSGSTTGSTSVPTGSSFVNIGSITLPPGLWIVRYMASFQSNATGSREIALGQTTSDRTTPTAQACNGRDTKVVGIAFLDLRTATGNTTRNVYARHNAGTALLVYPAITALRLY